METQETKNNFWTYTELNSVHVELSSKCNAACPCCQRFIMNSPVVKSTLIQDSVSLEQFKNWFPPEAVSKIKEWIFCGTYGDPMAAKDVYKILEYVCENGQGNIQLNTNGGLGSTELYTNIGKLFAKYKHVKYLYRYLTFSIDGLEDTNHIYRRNVIWSKVWKNLMAYVETGASANWDFLHFKHNSHQIEQAQNIAKEHKINFVVKNPYGVEKTAMPVYNKKFRVDYVIEHPTDNGYPPYVPAGNNYVPPRPAKINVEGCITCYSKRTPEPGRLYKENRLEIYVDSQGNVLPCCFVAVSMVQPTTDHGRQVYEIQQSMNNANNLKHHSLKDILDNGILEVWSRSWEEKSIAACWHNCGKTTSKVRIIDKLYKKDE